MAKKIVVVDDEPEFLEMLEEIITQSGYEVSACDNGREALDLIRATKPDMALLDVMLPGMDGHAITAALAKDDDTNTIPIIIISALEQSRGMFEKYPQVKAFCSKPFSPAELLQNIKNILEQV